MDEIVAGMEAIVVLDQHPLLRRDGRPGGRPRHHHAAERRDLLNVTDVQKNKGGKFMH